MYGTATSEQRKEIKEIQKLASSLEARQEYTVRKIYEVHKKNNWNWNASNTELRENLNQWKLLSQLQQCKYYNPKFQFY